MRAVQNLISPNFGVCCAKSAGPVSSPGQPGATQAERARFKRSSEYAEMLWAKWPQAEDWPGVLDVYESAAYLRVHYNTLFRACTPDRTGRARLAHQRIGLAYRISRAALDSFGFVPAHTISA